MSNGSEPRRIEPDFRRKVWGASRLEPWFKASDAPGGADGGDPVGEVWFPADNLLIKFIFTSQKL
jgi:mannose-6-phosphate isomerase class I